MAELLRVERLRSWYGRSQVLWDIDLSLAAGEGLGIVGRNGAGKSTLLRTVAGAHRHASGTVVLEGEQVLGETAFAIARQGLSLVREGAPVFADLSIAENIAIGAVLARRRGRQPLTHGALWESFPALEAMAGRKAGLLSGGQRQMLALATALMSRPSLLALDEPSAGLAPEAAATAFETIGRMRADGLCVLIAEQNLDWLVGVTTNTIELEAGRMQSGVTPAGVLRGEGEVGPW